jgi:hypothetical protein
VRPLTAIVRLDRVNFTSVSPPENDFFYTARWIDRCDRSYAPVSSERG